MWVLGEKGKNPCTLPKHNEFIIIPYWALLVSDMENGESFSVDCVASGRLPMLQWMHP